MRRTKYKSRSKDYLPQFEVQVSDPKFEIHKKLDKFGKKVGQCIFYYSTTDRGTGERTYDKEVRLPLVCLWGNPEDGEAIKAHLTVKNDDLQTIMFYHELLRAKEALTNREGMTMTASGQVVIRYGRPNTNRYRTTVELDNQYVERIFYDSKSMAITAILEHLKRFRMIGGINTASFLRVPDDILEQVGFIKSPDLMSFGQPMWYGDANILKSEESTWGEGKKKFDDLMTAFLEGLQAALQS